MKAGRGNMLLRAGAVCAACAAVAFTVSATRRLLYGDQRAPCYVVPDEWRAFLAPGKGKCPVRLEYKVETLKADRNRMTVVPLFPEGTVFYDMTINGDVLVPALVEGWYCAEIRRPGSYRISAGIDVKPEEKEGVFSLQLKKAVFVRSAVHVDSGEAVELTVRGVPGCVTGTPELGTHGVLHAGLLQDVAVEWRKPRGKPVRAGAAGVRPSTIWTIGEKLLSADCSLGIAITGGSRDRIKIILPHGADRLDIRKGVVKDWRADGREVTLFFGERVAGEFTVNMSFDLPVKGGETAVCPSFGVDDGRLEAGGYMVVINGTTGIILESSVKGLEPVSDLDLPQDIKGMVKGRPQFVYRITARNAEPVFDVVTRELFPMVDTIADRADILSVIYEGGEAVTRATYSVRNNRRQFLKMKLPRDSRLFSVTVDNRARIVSEKDGVFLVPLEDSIQTLGGLVPFPVEVIYFRQSGGLSAGSKTVVDLPELPDVPVALVNASLFYPENLEVKTYMSSLAATDKPSPAGSLYFLPAQNAQAASTNCAVDHINDVWAYNAYNVGYEAYRQNRLEEAEQYLSQTADAVPGGGGISAVSGNLLRNIKAGRGEVAGKDKMEKARISAIQGTLAGMNEQIEARQSQMINLGLENIREGNDELGAELLKEAQKMGREISQRGGSKLRQKAVSRAYDAQLSAVEGERRRGAELEEKYATLRKEAREMIEQASSDGKASQAAGRLGEGLLIAADEENLSPKDMQVDDIWSEQENAPQVSAGAQAQVLKQKIINAPASAPAFVARNRQSKGLKDRNVDLTKKISVMEKALAWARSGRSAPGAPVQAGMDHVQESISRKKEALTALKSRIAVGGSGAPAFNDYLEVRKDLENMERQVAASGLSFGGLDGRVGSELAGLKKEIGQVRSDVSDRLGEMGRQDSVTISVTNIIDVSNYNTVKAFERYFGDNYSGTLGDGDFSIRDGALSVGNDGTNPGKLAWILEKFRSNSGNAVSMAGKKFDADIESAGLFRSWFTNSTVEGNKYAVLDEAQYRTLVCAGKNSRPGAGDDRKEVIVGTTNKVAGSEVLLENADAGGNRINVDGNTVFLPHGNYYAVVDGNEVSVIKAGTVHYWQAGPEPLAMDADMPFRIDISKTGRQMHFEKTLLSGGESPDIEIMF